MSNTNLIEFFNVTKKFGQNYANKNISFSIRAGEIHGLIGENGAGKSTIMKILFGMYQADEGSIKIREKETQIKSPLDAFKLKIGMVHQHFMLSPEHTALENILLVQDTQNPFEFFFNSSKIKKLKLTAEKYGFTIPWNQKVKELSVGIQQRIEILKLLNLDHEILIFDEPTAVLTPKEIDEFLEQLQTLKKNKKTIILITHKLKEIKKVCDRITIFQKGSSVGTYNCADLSESEMAEKMVGRHVNFNKRDFKKFLNSKKIVELSQIQINDHNLNCEFNLKINQGEILGIAGIEGHGQQSLIHFLLNPRQFLKSIKLKSSEFNPSSKIKIEQNQPVYKLFSENVLNKSKSDIRKLSLGVLPEDRLRVGALHEKTGYENFILGYENTSQWQRYSWLKWDQIKKLALEQFKSYHVEPPTPEMLFHAFSGGNQQKIVVARELLQNPNFIIASHPTRGVDIGAIEFIHEKIIQAQERGAAILLISSELDELTKLADRILVLRDGQFAKEFKRSEFDEKLIGASMLGVDDFNNKKMGTKE